MPDSGNYTFYVSCDDWCELWKHDVDKHGIEKRNKKAEKIIAVYQATGYLEWNKYATQKRDLENISFCCCCRCWCFPTCHLSLVTCHLSLVTCHLSLVTCHLSLVTCHLSLVTCHLSLVTKSSVMFIVTSYSFGVGNPYINSPIFEGTQNAKCRNQFFWTNVVFIKWRFLCTKVWAKTTHLWECANQVGSMNGLFLQQDCFGLNQVTSQCVLILQQNIAFVIVNR